MSSEEPPDQQPPETPTQAQQQEEPPPFEPDLELITYLEKRADPKPGRVADR